MDVSNEMIQFVRDLKQVLDNRETFTPGSFRQWVEQNAKLFRDLEERERLFGLCNWSIRFKRPPQDDLLDETDLFRKAKLARYIRRGKITREECGL